MQDLFHSVFRKDGWSHHILSTWFCREKAFEIDTEMQLLKIKSFLSNTSAIMAVISFTSYIYPQNLVNLHLIALIKILSPFKRPVSII